MLIAKDRSAVARDPAPLPEATPTPLAT